MVHSSIFTLIFTLLFSFKSAFAFVPTDKKFLKRWNISKSFKQGPLEFKTFQRLITVGKVQYPVGQITHQKILKKNPLDFSDVIQTTKDAFEIEKWQIYKLNNAVYMKGFWEKGNRNLSLMISEGKKDYILSFAAFRVGYNFMEVESYIIQHSLSKTHIETNNKKTTSLHKIIEHLFPSAHANPSAPPFLNIMPTLDSITPSDLGPSIVNPGTVGGGDRPTSIPGVGDLDLPVGGDINVRTTSDVNFGLDQDSADRIQGIGDSWIDRTSESAGEHVRDANGNWRDSNGNWRDSNGNWRDTNGELVRANDSFETLNGEIAKGNENFANFNEQLEVSNKNWKESNLQMKRANDIAEKLTDPKHMFLLAGATAAGSVVGGFAANLAIDGITKGVDWLIEFITQKKAKAERLKLFQTSRKKWEETLQHSLELERAIDNFLAFHDVIKTIKDKLPPGQRENFSVETILDHLGAELLIKKKHRERTYELFTKSSGECESHYSRQLVAQDKLIKNMGDIITQLQNGDGLNINIFDDRYFCQRLDQMMRKLVDAENALQKYRVYMITGQTEWRQNQDEGLEDLQERTEQFYKDVDRNMRREVKLANEKYKRSRDHYITQMRNACRSEGSRCIERRKSSPEYQMYMNELAQTRDRQIQAARAQAELRKSSPVRVNDSIVDQSLDQHKNWFQQLEDQQFCSLNPENKHCKNLSNFTYNGVFYVKNKAMDKFADLCPQTERTIPEMKEAEARRAAEDTANNGRVVEAPVPTPVEPEVAPKKKGGFFSFIGDIFKGIFNFFGRLFGGGSSTYGEDPAASTSYEQTVAAGESPDVSVIDEGRSTVPRRPVPPEPIPVDTDNRAVDTQGTSFTKEEVLAGLDRNQALQTVLKDAKITDEDQVKIKNFMATNLSGSANNQDVVSNLNDYLKTNTSSRYPDHIMGMIESSPNLARYFFSDQHYKSEKESDDTLSMNWTAGLTPSDQEILNSLPGISLTDKKLDIDLSKIPAHKMTPELWQTLEQANRDIRSINKISADTLKKLLTLLG